MNNYVEKLEKAFENCSDCMLSEEYRSLLNGLADKQLTEEEIYFLCEKISLKEFIWEIRFEHLRVLLLNKSSYSYDLQSFYSNEIKKSRKIALKLFLIRGYSIYAEEEELAIIMKRFCSSLENNHDYIDYECILSVAGLPFLVKTYGYDCFVKALEKAKEEYQKIDPILRGFFTLNDKLEQVNLIPHEETIKRTQQFLSKHSDI